MTAFQVDPDEEDLPFEDDQFASIHSGEVVDYLRDLDHLFREVRRCLRPGGLFVVSTPNLASVHNRLALLAERLPFPMRQEFDRLVCDQESVSPLSVRCAVDTYSTLRSVLSSHGFEVVQVLGACSTPPESSLAHRLFEAVVSVLSLSYRNVFVCRNPA